MLHQVGGHQIGQRHLPFGDEKKPLKPRRVEFAHAKKKITCVKSIEMSVFTYVVRVTHAYKKCGVLDIKKCHQVTPSKGPRVGWHLAKRTHGERDDEHLSWIPNGPKNVHKTSSARPGMKMLPKLSHMSKCGIKIT